MTGSEDNRKSDNLEDEKGILGREENSETPLRRSARLLNKNASNNVDEKHKNTKRRREDDDDEDDDEDDGMDSNNDEVDSSSESQTNSNNSDSTDSNNSDSANDTSMFQSDLFNQPSIISFSIGFSRLPSATTTSTTSTTTATTTTSAPRFITSPQDLPSDIQWIFNGTSAAAAGVSSGGIPQEVLDGLLRRGGASGNGIAGFSFPVGFRGGLGLGIELTSNNSTNNSTNSNTNNTTNNTTSTTTSSNDNPFFPSSSSNNTTPSTASNELLHLARQMFQIISRARNSRPDSVDFSDEFSTDIEPLLNDFFERIFGVSMRMAGGTVRSGLAADKIAALPLVSGAEGGEEFDCAVCRETARPGEEKCVTLPQCKHCFHYDCIEPWLKRVPSCPICRKVVE